MAKRISWTTNAKKQEERFLNTGLSITDLILIPKSYQSYLGKKLPCYNQKSIWVNQRISKMLGFIGE